MESLYDNDPRVVRVSPRQYRFPEASDYRLELDADGCWYLWGYDVGDGEGGGWYRRQESRTSHEDLDAFLWSFIGPPQK